ncbi:MAG: hypothetical protein MMC33_009766 [Icmadophila ericetorum]|nr:hypothetical protein [Icmadophila ericetorum]
MATIAKSYYPPPEYIAGVYGYRAVGNYAKFKEYVSASMVSETKGKSALAGKGKYDYALDVSQQLDGLIDPSKENKVEIIRAIGGGDQAWSTIVAKTTGTTKAGKTLSHEYVLLVRWDLDWKIAEIHAFHDDVHIGEHLKDVKG